MANRIFETVLNRKIENFTQTFIEDSKSIFYDKKKLIHPGEFGKYRENSLIDLLKLITKHKISDGFIITPNDKISTQIDVVIYNKDEAPILENNYCDFFSIESVLAIGEVKSTLDKTSFASALQKLAENKKLQEGKKGTCLTEKHKNKVEQDNLISFLVCASTSFDIQEINFDEIYQRIDDRYWHNFILVIDKGLISYEFRFNDLSISDKQIFTQNGGDLNAVSWYGYPRFSFNGTPYKTKIKIHKLNIDDKYFHIKLFISELIFSLDFKYLYKTDFAEYLEIPISKIFQ